MDGFDWTDVGRFLWGIWIFITQYIYYKIFIT